MGLVFMHYAVYIYFTAAEVGGGGGGAKEGGGRG